MNAAVRIVGVDASAIGADEVVTADELADKLGRPAWHVWQVLVASRNRRGFTSLGVDDVASCPGFVSIAPRNAKKAMRRLELAGLVERVGWAWNKTAARKVYWRRVYGAPMLDVRFSTPSAVAIPRETKRWLSSAFSWGGRRQLFPGTGSRGSNVSHERVGQEGPLIREREYMSKYNSHGSSPSEKTAAVAAPGSVVETAIPGLGTFLGPAVPSPVRRIYGYADSIPGAPPFPGPAVIRVAQVPPAPKLLATDPIEYRVKQLTLAYRAAIQSVYGGRCFLYAKGVTRASKDWAVLEQAVELLTDFEIAPIAWCLFNVRRWRNIKDHEGPKKLGRKGPKPPLAMVFAASSILKRCEDPDDRYVVRDCATGGRLVYGDHHRKLGAKYDRMLRLINRDGVEPTVAAAEVFPGTLYHELVDAAKAEACELQLRIDRDVAAGKDVWTV